MGHDGDIGVRRSGRRDYRALADLGHTPDLLAVLCPTLMTKLAWSATGTRAPTFVAFSSTTGGIIGSVQFVRSCIDPATWMFGHWRVPSDRRGEGIGGRLLSEGLRLLPTIQSLYSLVEERNTASIRAHRRLAFKEAPELLGTAALGILSTIGPPAPSIRLEKCASEESLLSIYRRAMGEIWISLFAGFGVERLSHVLCAPIEAPAGRGGAWCGRRALVLAVHDGETLAGFVVSGRGRTVLFAEPDACDAGFLARVAARLIALGRAREDQLSIRGLPLPVLRGHHAIRGWVLMGMPEASHLRR